MAHRACPRCLGGVSREMSLMVFRDGYAVVSKCLRAKCGYYNRVPYDGTNDEGDGGAFAPKPFEHPTYGFGSASATFWYERYGFVPYDGWAKEVSQDADVLTASYYLPVRDYYGALRGGLLRRFANVSPKALAFPLVDHPWMAWYRSPDVAADTERVVAVEDQISAMKAASLGYTAVALLGTAVTPDRIAELREHADTVLLALDLDAFGKAVAVAQKHPWVWPIFIEEDIKDMSYDEIHAALGGSVDGEFADG